MSVNGELAKWCKIHTNNTELFKKQTKKTQTNNNNKKQIPTRKFHKKNEVMQKYFCTRDTLATFP